MESSSAVDPRHVGYTHAMYALHAASILTGILGGGTIAGRFVFGLPSIIAIIMNYARRGDVAGTWLATHFRWQRFTFWTAFVALIVLTLVFGPLTLLLIGIPFLILGYSIVGIWVAYRVVRGWIALNDGRPMPSSETLAGP